jgi:predicted metal-dependent enzyme (double-stranded beta helix superfamily)
MTPDDERGNFKTIMPTPLTISETTNSTSLRGLICAVRAVVKSEPDAKRIGPVVADLLQPYLCCGNFLTAEQLEPDEIKYRQHILHVEPDGSFSIVALVWLPGQATPIHDHVSWCVVGVHRGEEQETVYEMTGSDADPHLVVTGRSISRAGTVVALVPPGDIHHVANNGHGLAVSLHIYGADISVLGSSIRRRYDLEVRPASRPFAGAC